MNKRSKNKKQRVEVQKNGKVERLILSSAMRRIRSLEFKIEKSHALTKLQKKMDFLLLRKKRRMDIGVITVFSAIPLQASVSLSIKWESKQHKPHRINQIVSVKCLAYCAFVTNVSSYLWNINM